MTESQELFNDMQGVLHGIGQKLVSLDVSRHKGSTQIRAVVYREGGTGIDECSKAHRLIEARVPVALGVGEGDFDLGVSSPGTDRVFRSDSEYGICTGRGVHLGLDDGSAVGGRIASSDGSTVVIATAEGDKAIPLARIKKGKLDYSQEGR